MAEHLNMGSGEGIPCSALFARVAFALLIELSLPQPTSFLSFALLILIPSHLDRE